MALYKKDICLSSLLWVFLACSMPKYEHHMKYKMVLVHLSSTTFKKTHLNYHIKQDLVAHIQVVLVMIVI